MNFLTTNIFGLKYNKNYYENDCKCYSYIFSIKIRGRMLFYHFIILEWQILTRKNSGLKKYLL